MNEGAKIDSESSTHGSFLKANNLNEVNCADKKQYLLMIISYAKKEGENLAEHSKEGECYHFVAFIYDGKLIL